MTTLMTTPYPTTTLWTCPFMIPLGMYQSLRSRTAKFDPQRIRQHSVTREARAIPIGEHILVQRTSSRILPPSIDPPCLPIHKIASVSFPLAPTGFTPSVFSVDFLSVDTSISYTYHFDFTFTELISGLWEVRFVWSPTSSLRVRLALYHYKTHWPLYTKLTLQCSTCHCLCISPAVYTSAGASLAV